MEASQENTSARGLRVAIIVSRFNDRVTSKLLQGAEECLQRYGGSKENCPVYNCPGAFELPQVANALASEKSWDAIICLGAVIRGETPHFEYVSSAAARGIQDVALKHAIPVVFGVLTTNNESQALERAGGKLGNKGWDAGLAAIEMALLFKKLKRKAKRPTG